jgi:hypothetical protein
MGKMIEVKPNLVLYIYMDSWGGKLRAQYLWVTPSGLEPARPGNWPLTRGVEQARM